VAACLMRFCPIVHWNNQMGHLADDRDEQPRRQSRFATRPLPDAMSFRDVRTTLTPPPPDPSESLRRSRT
jgi:hypothetical protein